MAALETPWIDSMSSPPRSMSINGGSPSNGDPPTYAAFSPATLSHSASTQVPKQRQTLIVHQKSPLLVATPPQITRALAYSHPFILPLNRFLGLLTWTSGDPWESFLLVAAFWATTLYGDVVLRWAGPIIVVIGLILGMYFRRYSPLSSTGWTGEKGQKGHRRGNSEETGSRHHKSLDEIVDTLKLFTSRCNILLDPMLRLTDFLSTQQTATSATTRPALTTLFIRILLVTPAWFLLTLPPFYIITTKRIALAFGTIVLTWHSRPARISRTILWRSRMVRHICSFITGFNFNESEKAANGDTPPALPPRNKSANEIAASLAAKRRPESPGIRFTFALYENQRRWLGLGWTSSMFAYERASWTDEQLNPAPPKDAFELPEVEGGHARWRWVDGSTWRIDGVPPGGDENQGWIYYDNKWRDGRRGQDGWGRYTRRRKWIRDAELVEVTPSTEITPSPTPYLAPSKSGNGVPVGNSSNSVPSTPFSEDETVLGSLTSQDDAPPEYSSADINDDTTDGASTRVRKRRWFRRDSRATSVRSGTTTGTSESDRRREEEDDILSPLEHTESREQTWNIGDDVRMQLG